MDRCRCKEDSVPQFPSDYQAEVPDQGHLFHVAGVVLAEAELNTARWFHKANLL